MLRHSSRNEVPRVVACGARLERMEHSPDEEKPPGHDRARAARICAGIAGGDGTVRVCHPADLPGGRGVGKLAGYGHASPRDWLFFRAIPRHVGFMGNGGWVYILANCYRGGLLGGVTARCSARI